MTTNVSYEYVKAEKEYYKSSTDEERLKALEEMIRFVPGHKGGENLRKNLKNRYKKLKQELEKSKKSKKRGVKKGIRKEEMQAVLTGLTNSGKSSILKALTNAHPRVGNYGFTTQIPEIGTLNFHGCNIQIIDMPPIASENFDKGVLNNTDLLLIIIEKISDIDNLINFIKNPDIKKLIVFNKIDLHDNNEKRKINETLRSKKYNFVVISAIKSEGIEKLKEKIFESFNVIRVYTKRPGKDKEKDDVPVILPPNSTLGDVAEKILHGYSKKVKYAKIWGPSSKFSGQQIGLKHIVKDMDVVEFVTK